MSLAIITGVAGQDGSYLAEFLLRKGYRVVGTVRNLNVISDSIAAIRDRIEVIETDLVEQTSVDMLIQQFCPDEVYNLAARSSGSELWSFPVLTGDVNGLAVTRLLEAISKGGSKVRFCQASSSEVFGNAVSAPQNETTALRPRNPYGVAKSYAQWITSNYRDVKGLFACSTILFNHESPRRTLDFVTRKISHTVAKIKMGLAMELRLGDLEAKRDWGFAGDYVQAMWLTLQQETPDDYVIATGELHTVREFCEIAFAHVGLNYKDYVVQDAMLFRSPERGLLVGDPAKAKRVLGWQRTVTFECLVKMMVDADLDLVEEHLNRASSGEMPGRAKSFQGDSSSLGDL